MLRSFAIRTHNKGFAATPGWTFIVRLYIVCHLHIFNLAAYRAAASPIRYAKRHRHLRHVFSFRASNLIFIK